MPNGIDIGLAESRNFKVAIKTCLTEHPFPRLAKGYLIDAPILLDFGNRIAQIGGDLLPLMLVEHGDFHLTAPAIKRLRHSRKGAFRLSYRLSRPSRCRRSRR